MLCRRKPKKSTLQRSLLLSSLASATTATARTTARHVAIPAARTRATAAESVEDDVMEMKDKEKFITGLVIFVVACLLPLFAVWRYTRFGLTAKDFHISATVFHLLLIGDLVLFYVQWKICPEIWYYIRNWFYDHVWAIMFALTIIVVVQSLLFFRLYDQSGLRHRHLIENVRTVISNQEDMEDNIRHREILDAIEELRNALEKLKSDQERLNPSPTSTHRNWY